MHVQHCYAMCFLCSQGLLKQVRPLPDNALRFQGLFIKCHNSPPCPRRHCTYAHSDLELLAWNKQKKERKLKVSYNAYVTCSTVDIQLQFQ